MEKAPFHHCLLVVQRLQEPMVISLRVSWSQLFSIRWEILKAIADVTRGEVHKPLTSNHNSVYQRFPLMIIIALRKITYVTEITGIT